MAQADGRGEAFKIQRLQDAPNQLRLREESKIINLIHRIVGALILGIGLATTALAGNQVSKSAILDTYANIAAARYTDSLTAARGLQAAVDALIANPSAEAPQAAREAWLRARVPYRQTEVYRFGNAIVNDWEGKVNAWPLDEGLIDYVDASYGGPLTKMNSPH